MRSPTLLLFVLTVLACAAKPATNAPPSPVVPLPGARLAGQSIAVWPLNTMRVDSSLGWEGTLSPRRRALDRADSIIAEALTSRRAMIKWVLPGAVRRAAKQAPGLLADPDQMATGLLKARAEATVPEALRAQLRELTGVATGGRYALVPASLAFVRDRSGRGRADLVVSLVDVRRGVVSWTTISSGIGDDPWNAIAGAARSLTAEEARS